MTPHQLDFWWHCEGTQSWTALTGTLVAPTKKYCQYCVVTSVNTTVNIGCSSSLLIAKVLGWESDINQDCIARDAIQEPSQAEIIIIMESCKHCVSGSILQRWRIVFKKRRQQDDGLTMKERYWVIGERRTADFIIDSTKQWQQETMREEIKREIIERLDE